jgi:hypothetical protein
VLHEPSQEIKRSGAVLFFKREPPDLLTCCSTSRLVELGCADTAWAAAALRDFEDAERDPSTLMITPLVLEIVAERST